MKPESHWDAMYDHYRREGLSPIEAASKTERRRRREQSGPWWLWVGLLMAFLYFLFRSLA